MVMSHLCGNTTVPESARRKKSFVLVTWYYQHALYSRTQSSKARHGLVRLPSFDVFHASFKDKSLRGKRLLIRKIVPLFSLFS